MHTTGRDNHYHPAVSVQSPFDAPRHDLLEKLGSSIEKDGPRTLTKRRLELVLGTDREIGGEHSPERRVGITPDHVARLLQFFAAVGARLDVRVHTDAGIHSGWADADYVHAGATVIRREEIPFHQNAPDVLHALKEPSKYEADFPGPYLRIGALHSGDFSLDGGFARLLARGDVAIFDGSTIGAPGRFRIPIRGQMSRFAGEIAAEWILDHLAEHDLRGRVVVAGGGRVGASCVRKVAGAERVNDIVVCEAGSDAERLTAVARELSDLHSTRVAGVEGLDHPNLVSALDGAVAVVFAVFRPGQRAPRVASLRTLLDRLAPRAIVIDVSIDERGAIQDDEAGPDWNSEALIPWFERRLESIHYRAVPNMPREYPRTASAAHGDVVTPYLATLLYLSAREGGPMAAVERLLRTPVDPFCEDPGLVAPADALEALMKDLRNGLAVYPAGGRLEIGHAMPEADRRTIEALLGTATETSSGNDGTMAVAS